MFCKGQSSILDKEVEDENRRGEELKIHLAVGFLHVIDLLSSEQKLIVGHNCFLDVAHIYRKFFGELPFSAEEFVASANKHLPYIIDTEVLLNSSDILKYWMRKSKTSVLFIYQIVASNFSRFHEYGFGFKSLRESGGSSR